MKILAIRGKNLASLTQFEIGFTSGPLSPTSIFAITGPTGAGKSTILDTLCLALFDRVPRFATATANHDVRRIIRQGAIEALAEADFVGVDGEYYRASWSVWRARRKASGRLQDQRVHLYRLHGAEMIPLTESTKTATLQTIRQKLGLGFSEFRRAVLLAQGDFAAFLKARSDERASLLEQMTGTNLYASLSRAAFVRAKSETEKHRFLVQQLQAVETLSAEIQSNLKNEILELEQQHSQLIEDLQTAQHLEQWFETNEALTKEYKHAQEQNEQAIISAQALPEIEAQISHLEIFSKLHPLQKHIDISLAELVDVQRQTKIAESEVEQIETQFRACHARVDQASAAHQAALTTVDKLEPLLSKASELDEELKQQQQQQQQLNILTQQAEKELSTLHKQLEQLTEQLRTLTLSDQTDDQWLAKQRFIEELRQDTKDTEPLSLLHELAQLTQELRYAQPHQQMRSQELKRLEPNIVSLQNQLEQANLRVTKATAEQTSPLASLPWDAVSWTRELEHFHRLATAVENLRTPILAKQQRQTQQKKRQVQLQKHQEDVENLQLQLQDAHRGAEHISEQLRKQLKHQLQPGEPCPVCDIIQPPAIGSSSKCSEIAPDTPSYDYHQMIEHLSTASGQAASAQLAIDCYLKELEAIKQTEQTEQQLLTALRTELSQIWLSTTHLHAFGLGKVGLLLPREMPNSIDALAPALDCLKSIKSQLEAHAQAAKNSQHHQTQIASDMLNAHTEQEKYQALLDSSLERRRYLIEEQQAYNQEYTQLLAQHTQKTEYLQHLLAKSPNVDLGLTDPKIWVDELLDGLADAERRQTERRARRLQQEAIEQHRRDIQAHYEAKCRHLATLQKTAHQTTEKSQDLNLKRSELFNGNSVIEVREELKAKIRKAEETSTEYSQQLVHLDHKRVEALTLLRLRLEEEQRARHRVTQAQLAMQEALALYPTKTHQQLIEQLSLPRQDRQELEDRKTQLLRQLAQAEATQQDRQHRLEQHHLDMPTISREKNHHRIKTGQRLSKAILDSLSRLRGTLEHNEHAHRRRDELQPQVQQQEIQARLWSDLSDLIGSADGSKFRTFAQSLTLEILIAQANHHLRALRPRYALKKCSVANMEFEVVDHDMGQELRTTASLSGGETFLVSLALALALSDLSAPTTSIESLFIDEGFGALDTDSLEVALGVLDQLQATGRTIGIVSHIPEVAERIGFEVHVKPTGIGHSVVELRTP
ncbi:MAG: AAA family ATPase [Myxococcales bacterium]|nr:AAA family ATPase [Myxococcales bacterium]